jgi:hypothetical protein
LPIELLSPYVSRLGLDGNPIERETPVVWEQRDAETVDRMQTFYDALAKT